jgi:DNA adenine methylase
MAVKNMIENIKMRPPLKWAGGKRWLVPHILPIWEKHKNKRLVEPFAGGLAITLGLMPKKALINDINEHLINFYNQIKADFDINIETENDKDTYYRHRETFNKLLKNNQAQTKKAAELFYYLNRTCFNGLCRFNKSGEFNVPIGSYKTINYTKNFSEYKKIFKGWKFSDKDFSKIKIKDDDFIYADPPYDVPFTQYSSGGFTWEDQVRTAELLAKHPGPVVLSNQATDRILKLYRSLGYKIKLLEARIMISCTGDRSKVLEVLATRNI